MSCKVKYKHSALRVSLIYTDVIILAIVYDDIIRHDKLCRFRVISVIFIGRIVSNPLS